MHLSQHTFSIGEAEQSPHGPHEDIGALAMAGVSAPLERVKQPPGSLPPVGRTQICSGHR